MLKILSLLLLLLLSFSAAAQDLVLISSRPSTSVTDVLDSFGKFETYYSAKSDRRKLFVRIYTHITHGIEKMIESREVENGNWLEDLIVGFSEEYRKAVHAYETNDSASLPLPWKFDFDHAKKRDLGLPTQLLLSLNSHIIHDLPITMAASVKRTSELDHYKNDYFKLNEMFKSVMPELFVMVYKETHYNRFYNYHPTEVLKRQVVNQLVLSMRKSAWESGVNLAQQASPLQRVSAIKKLALQTVKVSELVIALDPFLSTKQGELFPEKSLEKSWDALKKIAVILRTQPPTNLVHTYRRELQKYRERL
jgi:Family of unknown function (DUF5995)